ncbi:MAG: recombinase zinc beta ribbon domain-containing protein [Chloroflexi bacterium]|nr:recombinase zinc beta ribbon domain-containing protein [Chloroflexota bacterium]
MSREALAGAESVDRILKNAAYVGRHRSGVKYPPIIDEETWWLVARRRATNRHVKPSSGSRRWPLQGRITCECGSAWRVNTGRKTRRTYFCSGRESRTRRARDGHPCTIPRQPADALERAVWLALVDALTDADSFAHAIDAAMADLRAREDELERGARPIREGLDEVRRRKERLGERRLADAFSAERFSNLLAEHERRELELERQLNDLGPDLEEELKRAQELLRGAERLKRNALRRAERGLPIGVFSLDPDLAESDEVDMLRAANVWQITKAEPDNLSSELTEALDRLQMEIIAHPDRLELRGLVAFDAPLPQAEMRDPHAPQVARGLR